MTPREQHRAAVARYVAPDASTRPEAHAAFMATWECQMEDLDETIRAAYSGKPDDGGAGGAAGSTGPTLPSRE